MKRIALISLLALLVLSCSGTDAQFSYGKKTISKESLLNKIKGGWAGQAIGCTYGGPTEFLYCGRMIDDSISIEWPEHFMKHYYDTFPGLYDDIYMDLTFVEVFDRLGLDAPIGEFAKAFSSAGYPLWHANQQARYNLRQGMDPSSCGIWTINPHADDIDFQIESDFAGLMSPGMVNAAAGYTDGIGHLMNYGDGWYGGVYVAAMYALAFVCDDVDTIVNEALKLIPSQSRYYKCMEDVISWHGQYPDDWKATWKLCQDKWAYDIGCPDGVDMDLNIDAVINSAYILIGLLYGEGDFGKTLEIAARCGQDSDCNPASAGGILGTLLGYDAIPEKWMANLHEVEDINFAYTDISLNRAYSMSYNHALGVIRRNGGKVEDDRVEINCTSPRTVRFEESFSGHWPAGRVAVNAPIDKVGNLDFTGKGIVIGYYFMTGEQGMPEELRDYVAAVEVYLDGELSETVLLPADANSRKLELFYKYCLPVQEHTITLKWLNPVNVPLIVTSYLVYSEKPSSVNS